MTHIRQRGILKVIRRLLPEWGDEVDPEQVFVVVEAEYGQEIEKIRSARNQIARELRTAGYKAKHIGHNRVIYIKPEKDNVENVDCAREQHSQQQAELPLKTDPPGDRLLEMVEAGEAIYLFIESLKEKIKEMVTDIQRHTEIVKKKDDDIEYLVIERRRLNDANMKATQEIDRIRSAKDRQVGELQAVVKSLNERILGLNQQVLRLERIAPKTNNKFNMSEIARFTNGGHPGRHGL